MHIKGRLLLLALVFIPIGILVIIAVLHTGDWSDDIPSGMLVLQTGVEPDNEVYVAMQGVVYDLDRKLLLAHLSHDHNPSEVNLTAKHLVDVARYWPQGTVFASFLMVNPNAESPLLALKTDSGHFFLSHESNLLELVAENLGLDVMREVNTESIRSPYDDTYHEKSTTLYIAALLAAERISFSRLGVIRQ